MSIFECKMNRRHFLSAGLGAVALVGASPLYAGCSGSNLTSVSTSTSLEPTLERLRSNGAKFGVSAGLPTSGVEGDRAVGIFPEIAEVVLQSLRVDRFTPVLTSFEGIIPGLQAGRVDLALPGLYITAKRCSNILFSHPLIVYSDALVVPKGNPYQITAFADVVNSDLKVGTIAGSTGSEYLTKQGIPEDRQVIFPDLLSILDGMRAGRVDVAGSDAIALGYLLGRGYADDLELVPEKTAGFSSGVGFAQNATDLQTAFNDELRKAQAAGTLAPIYEKWNVPAKSTEGVADLTQAAECLKAT